jgi:hypothetical protein
MVIVTGLSGRFSAISANVRLIDGSKILEKVLFLWHYGCGCSRRGRF